MEFSVMLRYFLLISNFHDASSFLASCTEDSQCPSKFFCAESAHYCRECLRCEDFNRDEPLTPVSCIKSVLQCGSCLKSVIHKVGTDKLNEKCITTGEEEGGTPHSYLPPYAWAVITVAFLLMVVTLCVFLKTKAFKVTSYSSRTSVRTGEASTSCLPLAPPPYNYPTPSALPQSNWNDTAPEIQRLVESPQQCKKPSPIANPLERPREGSANQAARVYNQPAYVRGPQSQITSVAPEDAILSSENSSVVSPIIEVAGTPEAAISKLMSFKPDGVSEENNNRGNLSRTTSRNDQDSNNNRSTTEDSSHQGATSSEGLCRDAYIIGGPSFVINVVENINNIRQRNETNFSRSD